MDQQEIEKYQGKRIKLFLKSGTLYTCNIISVGKTSLTIRDKFDDQITISNDNIALIKEVNHSVNS